MRKRKLMITYMILCMMLCSCSKNEKKQLSKETEVTTTNDAQAKVSDSENGADKNMSTTSEYDGTDPYQGTIGFDDNEESMSIFDTLSK